MQDSATEFVVLVNYEGEEHFQEQIVLDEQKIEDSETSPLVSSWLHEATEASMPGLLHHYLKCISAFHACLLWRSFLLEVAGSVAVASGDAVPWYKTMASYTGFIIYFKIITSMKIKKILILNQMILINIFNIIF